MSSEVKIAPASPPMAPPPLERPKITRISECKEGPQAIRGAGSTSEIIQKIGSLSISTNFTPRQKFPDSGEHIRRHTPSKEMTAELYELYESGRASRSEEKIKRWRISSHIPIGSGAYANVFLMNDVLTGKTVAGKLNQPDKIAYEAACDEYQSLHEWQEIPHVVRLLGGADYPARSEKMIVMERVEPSLSSILQPLNRLPFEHVISIFRQLLEMYQASSKRELVHTDLKPQNLAYKDGKLFIYDLGRAHCLKRDRFRPNTIQTLNYRAPEVILGEKYDSSIDLWSIGCIIYQIFCGRKFINVLEDTPSGQMDALQQIVSKIGPPPASFLAGCSKKPRFTADDGMQSLRNSLRAEARQRTLSGKKLDLFIQLLMQILKFEDRIDADRALEICNQIQQEISPQMRVKGIESKS